MNEPETRVIAWDMQLLNVRDGEEIDYRGQTERIPHGRYRIDFEGDGNQREWRWTLMRGLGRGPSPFWNVREHVYIQECRNCHHYKPVVGLSVNGEAAGRCAAPTPLWVRVFADGERHDYMRETDGIHCQSFATTPTYQTGAVANE